MDTTDPMIIFDENGNCSNCNSALDLAKRIWFPDERGERELRELFSKVKAEGKGKEYDCVVGLSGGVDSSYLAYLAVQNGLRPLVVHVDCGWNSELAVKNIENIVRKLNLELHTFVVDWEEMKDLQRAFFKASVPDQDIPQDHAIFAAIAKFAGENNIKYLFSGQNFSTESINPKAWGHQAMDYRHLKAIHARFGEHRLKNFPHVTFFQRYIYISFIRGINVVNPLNYIDYRKEDVIALLNKELDWQYYGGKHYESRFTKFFQSYYQPKKFNIDKRRSHFSSLIISGQMSRDRAIELIRGNSYNEDEIQNDLEYVAKKLDWSVDEFSEILNLPPQNHGNFPNNDYLFSTGLRIRNRLKKNKSFK